MMQVQTWAERSLEVSSSKRCETGTREGAWMDLLAKVQ